MQDAVESIAYRDSFGDFNQLVEQVLGTQSNDDFKGFEEKHARLIYRTCLTTQGVQRLYLLKSEYESSGGRKPDIALLDIRGGDTRVRYNYLIELKYLNADATASRIKSKRKEAYDQMQEYLALGEFEHDTRLKGMICVVVKDKIKCFEEVPRPLVQDAK